VEYDLRSLGADGVAGGAQEAADLNAGADTVSTDSVRPAGVQP
jgi:hypothetical protein